MFDSRGGVPLYRARDAPARMDRGSELVLMTSVLLVVMPVVAGPLVPGINLSGNVSASRPPGDGTADVSVRSVPGDSIQFAESDFGAETYHFADHAATVYVKSVEGNPRVNYAIDIPALALTDINSYHLARSGTGPLELRLRPIELDPDRITQESYEATIAVWLVTDGNEYESLYQETIKIEVRG